MKFFDRTLLAVMLPAIAWGFLGALKLYIMAPTYFGMDVPPS